MKLQTTTASAGETHALARRIGAVLLPGDVVVLGGELGTGKTVFAKGIAVALGISEPVLSPTFTVVREYDAPTRLVHVDVYRLDHLQELHDLGFDELLADDAVTVVEWGDRVSALLPAERLDVYFELGPADDDRAISFEPAGLSWAKRRDALLDAVVPATSGGG